MEKPHWSAQVEEYLVAYNEATLKSNHQLLGPYLGHLATLGKQQRHLLEELECEQHQEVVFLINQEIAPILQANKLDFMELKKTTKMSCPLRIEMKVNNLENWWSTKNQHRNLKKKKIKTRKRSNKKITKFKRITFHPTTTLGQSEELTQL